LDSGVQEGKNRCLESSSEKGNNFTFMHTYRCRALLSKKEKIGAWNRHQKRGTTSHSCTPTDAELFCPRKQKGVSGIFTRKGNNNVTFNDKNNSKLLGILTRKEEKQLHIQ